MEQMEGYGQIAARIGIARKTLIRMIWQHNKAAKQLLGSDVKALVTEDDFIKPDLIEAEPPHTYFFTPTTAQRIEEVVRALRARPAGRPPKVKTSEEIPS